jgi:hypothetical protein
MTVGNHAALVGLPIALTRGIPLERLIAHSKDDHFHAAELSILFEGVSNSWAGFMDWNEDQTNLFISVPAFVSTDALCPVRLFHRNLD